MIDQKKITDIVRELVLGPRPERTGPHYSAYELSRLSIRCHKWDSFNPFADATRYAVTWNQTNPNFGRYALG